MSAWLDCFPAISSPIYNSTGGITGLDREGVKPQLLEVQQMMCFFFSSKDPEALAQLMKNMPLTNDGKFLLLESETGDDTNGDGNEDLESEA